MAKDPNAPEQPELVAPSERPSALLGLLKRRYFRRMWTITTVSSLGDWLGVFALVTYAGELSGKPEFAVGGVLLFRVVPGLFFGPFAGVLADRFDRRRLMATADISRALLIATIPWVDQLWQLYVVSALMEMLGLMWTPSKDATIPNLVERDQLMTANQLGLITTYATFPISGALVALLAIPASFLARFDAFSVLKTQPVSLSFFVDSLTFLFSATMVLSFPRELMRAKRAQTGALRWNPFRDLGEGLRFIRRNRLVRTLVVGAWIAFTGGSAMITLGPIFADLLVEGNRAAEQAAWGSLIVAVGVGLVGGMVIAGALARYISRERIFPFGLMLSGTSAILMASMMSIRPAIALVVFIGLGAGVAWVTIFTLLQERIDDRLRGRTFATLYTGIQLSLFVGLAGWPFLAGAIGDHVIETKRYIFHLEGARIAMWGGGFGLFIAGALAARTMSGARLRKRRTRLHGLRLSPSMSGGSRGGLFIVFEGGEGAGKSTQMQLLREWLAQRGKRVVVTREPGGTAIAERIRNILLDPATQDMDPKTETLLFAASRAQHVAEVIRPALERGDVVLSDRYLDSSIAYQGLARGLGEDDVLHLNVWATDELLPDLVVLLHLDPEQGLDRSGRADRMEQEDVSFHRKVSDAYLHLAREFPSRFTVVDASGSVEQVHAQIRTAILPFVQEEREA